MSEYIEYHPLAPFLPAQAKVLLLGSFPPPKLRWRMDFYYPNYNNDMWRIMGLIFYQDKDYFIDVSNKTFKLELIQQFLFQYGIAISDTALSIIRLQDNASDKFLQVVEMQKIEKLLLQLPDCQTIITTGEKATEMMLEKYASELKLPKIGESISLQITERDIQLYRLPSSSRAYPLKLEKKAEYYQQVFRQLLL